MLLHSILLTSFTFQVKKKLLQIACPGRNALFEELSPASLHDMVVKQQADASTSNLMNLYTTTLSIETRTLSDSNTNVVGNVSTGSFQPIVPESIRKQVFDVFHSLSHPGIRVTQSLIKELFERPQMNSEIKDWVTTCVPSQTAHNKAPIKIFLAPDDRFSHIHIDLIGPLNESHGYYYALTIVDRFTRWRELFLFVTLKPKPSLMHFFCIGLPVLVALPS